MTTSGFGTYVDCGYSESPRITITSEGPASAGLSTYPGLTCTTNATTTNIQCDNRVTCSESSNFKSEFELFKTEERITTKQILTIDGEKFELTDNGAGLIQFVALGPTTSITPATKPLPPSTNSNTSSHSNRIKPFSKLLLGLVTLSLLIAQLHAQPIGETSRTHSSLSPLIFSLSLSLLSFVAHAQLPPFTTTKISFTHTSVIGTEPTCGITIGFEVNFPPTKFLIF